MHQDNEEVAMNKPQRTERQTGKAFFKVRYASSKPELAFSIYYTQIKMAFNSFPWRGNRVDYKYDAICLFTLISIISLGEARLTLSLL